MQSQATEAAGNGICVAHGYGLKISVHRGHLIVHDGIGRNRRTRRYHRVTSKLGRLILIGHTGYVTLEALRWLHDIGAGLIHIDSDGRLITTSAAAGPGHASLRRAQALAATSPSGVEIARELLQTKVAGQGALLPELRADDEAKTVVATALEKIRIAVDLPGLVAAEAEAAAAYWNAWAGIGVPLRGAARSGIPEHWLRFGKRHSPLSNGPRLACNPPNAILNYLYALLEAETVLACHAVGLDPMLGIFHTDQRYRSSLALDAMEAVRPTVDAYTLAMLTQRTLARQDFIETRQGNCRLTSGIAGRLAETIPTWRHHVAPVVEAVAQRLAQGSGTTAALGAPLTRAHHRAAWHGRAPDRQVRRSKSSTPVLPNACKDCGTYLPDRRQRYCDPCRSARWAKHAEEGRENAALVLARLRAEERDPAHGGRAAQIRGRKNAEHQRAVREWGGERLNHELFRREIQPGLRYLPIHKLVAATGLSPHYCSLIRLGKRVPHQRHWQSLRQAATGVHPWLVR
ncbi:MAG: CRISPR-associated endonuclease Cas1 [Solirubrobacteraceae bacterium]